jgi:hypothetical protein
LDFRKNPVIINEMLLQKIYFFCLTCCIAGNLFGQSVGDYQSFQTGNCNITATRAGWDINTRVKNKQEELINTGCLNTISNLEWTSLKQGKIARYFIIDNKAA